MYVEDMHLIKWEGEGTPQLLSVYALFHLDVEDYTYDSGKDWDVIEKLLRSRMSLLR